MPTGVYVAHARDLIFTIQKVALVCCSPACGGGWLLFSLPTVAVVLSAALGLHERWQLKRTAAAAAAAAATPVCRNMRWMIHGNREMLCLESERGRGG